MRPRSGDRGSLFWLLCTKNQNGLLQWGRDQWITEIVCEMFFKSGFLGCWCFWRSMPPRKPTTALCLSNFSSSGWEGYFAILLKNTNTAQNATATITRSCTEPPWDMPSIAQVKKQNGLNNAYFFKLIHCFPQPDAFFHNRVLCLKEIPFHSPRPGCKNPAVVDRNCC